MIEIIKQAAVEAVKASKPVDLVFGTVEAVNPLRIVTEQKLHLGPEQLMLSRNVTNYSIELVINGSSNYCTLKNGLKLNEKVILIRLQGGQTYLVLDRVVNQ